MSAAEAVRDRHHPASLNSPSPDTLLLATCEQLNHQQDEWQRLWVAAGRPKDASLYDLRDEEPAPPELRALRDYTRKVWPATDDPYTHLGEVRIDTAHRLVGLCAYTPEGVQAKAVAILALENVSRYSELRDDQWQLTASLLRDVAGSAARPIGAVDVPGIW